MATVAPAYQRKATPENSDPCLACGLPVFLNRTSAGRGKMTHRACKLAQRDGRPTACAYCGESFDSRRVRGTWTQTCGKPCRSKLQFSQGVHSFQKSPRYGETLTREEAARRTFVRGELARRKRRARLVAVAREPYTVQMIAERDKHRCGLCGRSVDMNESYPAPHSASVDHILPLSRGGDDTLANVQLAHLRCNLAKRDRV